MSNKKIKTIHELVSLVQNLNDQVIQSQCLVSMIDDSLKELLNQQFRSNLKACKFVQSDLIKIKSIGSVFGFCSPNLFTQSLTPSKIDLLSFLESI